VIILIPALRSLKAKIAFATDNDDDSAYCTRKKLLPLEMNQQPVSARQTFGKTLQ